MDFQLADEQRELRDGLRSFVDGTFPLDAIARFDGTGFDAAAWRALAEMGVFGLRRPADEGGVGLGSAEAVLAFAELGRRLVPGPVVWTHLAAGLVAGAAEGEVVVGGLDLCGPDAGRPYLVEHLSHLDALLLLRPDGLTVVDPSGIEAQEIGEPLDPLVPLHHAETLPEGEPLAGPDAARALRRDGAALVAGFQLGMAEATLELANAYAMEREQFGRPIGGIMAVKHLLADMFVRQEVARGAVYAAGALLDTPEAGDAERAVSSAKVTAGTAALRNARSCIQVHGGMGYTWEVPAHYYLKRSWVLADLFGGEDEHCERLAEIVAGSPAD